MNQGPNAATPTTKIAVDQNVVDLVIDGRVFGFVVMNANQVQFAVSALEKALEAGRAQGRAEAVDARAKPNPELVCILEDEPGRLTLETSRGVFKTLEFATVEETENAQKTILDAYAYALASGARPAPKPAPNVAERVFCAADFPEKVQVTTGPVSAAEIVANFENIRKIAEPTSKHLEALTVAQNTIAALRDDAKRLETQRDHSKRDADAAMRLLEEERSVSSRLRAERDANRSGLQAWERRARDAEAALDLIRAEIGVHPSRTPQEVAAAVKRLQDVAFAEDEEDEDDRDEAYGKARHDAEMKLLGLIAESCTQVEGDADAALKYAQAFAALRGAE